MTTYAMYPRFALISAITLGNQTVVEFTDNHDFTDYENVTFRVDRVSGTRELNNVTTPVLSHTDTTITVGIDSTFYTAFIAGQDVQKPPMVLPASSGKIDGDPLDSINLADSFDNRRV